MLDSFQQTSSPLHIAIDRVLEIKCARMRSFLSENEGCLHTHIHQLRQFATSPGGLVLDEIRAIVWPHLASSLVDDYFYEHDHEVGSSDSEFESAPSSLLDGECVSETQTTSRCHFSIEKPTLEELKTHDEWRQVQMDVHRTLARFPPNITEAQRVVLQDELTPLIVRILWESPRFRYYQGFHDVCLTLLLAVGVKSAEQIGLHLAKFGAFNKYLLRSLEDTVLRDLDMVYVLLWKNDEELERRMRSVELGSLFALSWPLTWFSHSLHHYNQIVLCFDLFFASHPVMPVYLTSAIVLWRSPAILRSPKDMPTLHHLLNVIPDELPVQALVDDAQDLFRLLPPAKVRGPLLAEYRNMLKSSAVKRPPLSVRSFRAWFIAGTATAAVYVLSRYILSNLTTSPL